MLLESTLLEKIVTRNVVKFTLESTQLENNFELILKALKAHDSVLQQYQDKFGKFQKQIGSLNKNQDNLVQSIKEVDKKRENNQNKINETVNIHDHRIKKLEKMIEQSKKINPQSLKQEKEDNLCDLLSNMKDLQSKVSKIQNTLDDYSLHSDRIRELDEASKKNQKDIQTLIGQLDKSKNKTYQRNIQQEKKESNNFSEQQFAKLRKDLDKLSEQIQDLLTQIQFQKELNQKVEQPLAKLKQNQDDLIKKIKKLSDQIWKLNDQIYNNQKEARQKDIETKHILDDILKQLANLKSQMDYERSLSARNTDTTRKPQSQIQTQNSPIRQRIESELKKQTERESDQSDLRKEIIQKLKQQKGDFTKAIKKLDHMTHKKDEEEKQRLNRLQYRIQKLEYLLQGKVDEDNLKKWMKYVQNKIGYLYRIVNVQHTEQDAHVGRKNWFCLSCDKKLDGYRGKVGTHLTGAQLRGKSIEADVVGGGMLFKNKSKLELPQFKK